MLLELPQVVIQKGVFLAEKYVAYQLLLERYNLKFANEYNKKSENIPGADEHDIKLLTTPHADTTIKTEPKRKLLPEALPRVDVIVDIDESDKVYDCCQSPLHKMGESSSEH
jgi:hypothetical protein